MELVLPQYLLLLPYFPLEKSLSSSSFVPHLILTFQAHRALNLQDPMHVWGALMLSRGALDFLMDPGAPVNLPS